MNAGDLDALVALYEATATLITQEGTAATGHAAIRAALGPIVAAKPSIRMHVVRSDPAGGDLAVLYNDWHLTVVGPTGDTIDVAGKAIEIVRRQPDGTWRFVYDDPNARG